MISGKHENCTYLSKGCFPVLYISVLTFEIIIIPGYRCYWMLNISGFLWNDFHWKRWVQLTVCKPSVCPFCLLLHGSSSLYKKKKTTTFSILKQAAETTRIWFVCVYWFFFSVTSSECKLFQLTCCRVIYLRTVCWFNFSLCKPHEVRYYCIVNVCNTDRHANFLRNKYRKRHEMSLFSVM